MKIDIKAEVRNITQSVDHFKVFGIPNYQRPYVWEEQQVLELLDDVKNAIDNDISEHFIGTITLSKENEDKYIKVNVIDGQQRITTLFIILNQLLRIYNQKETYIKDYKKYKKPIDTRRWDIEDLLGSTDNDGNLISRSLILQKTNDDFFKEYVTESVDNDENAIKDVIKFYKLNNNYQVNKYLHKAVQTTWNYLFDPENGYIDEDGKIILEKIKDFDDFIRDNIKFVTIEVGDEADAFLIFETLNDRGKSLSEVDLIKNKIFSNCSPAKNFKDIQKKWEAMISKFEEPTVFLKYIRHMYMTQNGFVTKQNLYKSVRDYLLSDASKTTDFIELLYTNHTKFLPLYDFDAIGGAGFPLYIERPLKMMTKLEFDLFNPLLMKFFMDYNDEKDQAVAIYACVNYLVKYISITKGRPSLIERRIGNMAKEEASLEALQSMIGNDKELDTKFFDYLVVTPFNPNSKVLFEMLTQLERYHDKTKSSWDPINKKDIQIEHILPQTVKAETENGKYWISKFEGEKIESYLNKLGNLTLLEQSQQSPASNKPYPAKSKIYVDSELNITKDIAKNYQEWDPESIDQRSQALAKELLEVFTTDFEKIRKSNLKIK